MNSLKEFLAYITNQFKFWYIIKEWEYGLHLRKGNILRSVDKGLYFKIPFLDFIYSQPNRVQEIIVTHINCLSKDHNNLTISATVFYNVCDILNYYLGYAEPNQIIAHTLKNLLNKCVSQYRKSELGIKLIEEYLNTEIKEIKRKGIAFQECKVITITDARPYRIIKDNLYSQHDNELDTQLF